MLKDVSPPVPTPGEVVEYPTSDGRPMGETDVHRDQMMDLIHALQVRYLGAPDIYVTGNLLLYYEEGDRNRHVSPDLMVVHGVPPGRRQIYKLWEEGRPPSVVFEITSRSTRSEDLGLKKGLYEFLGVREYVLFDPREEYLEPRLRVYRLAPEGYRLLEPGERLLETLELELVEVEGALRLRDPATGALLPTRLETELRAREYEERAQQSEVRARESEARARSEALARRRAEEELAALRREVERLRAAEGEA